MAIVKKNCTKFSIISNDSSCNKFEQNLSHVLETVDILKCNSLELKDIDRKILLCHSNYICLQINFEDLINKSSIISISDLFRSLRLPYVFILWNIDISNAHDNLQILGSNWPIEIRPIFIDIKLLESNTSNSSDKCKRMLQRSFRLARLPADKLDSIDNSLNIVNDLSELLIIENTFYKAEFDSFGLPSSTYDVMPLREPPEPLHGWKYRVAAPYLNEESKTNVVTAIETKSVSSASHWVKQMTQLLGDVYDTMPVVQPCCNGYNALVLALQAAKVGKGDAILIPAFTMIAVSNAVEHVGALCLYVDNEQDSYNPSPRCYVEAVETFHRSFIDTDDVTTTSDHHHYRRAIIKGLIVCHTYGVPADIEAIAELCIDNHWLLMEDISECVGVRVALKDNSVYRNNVMINNNHSNRDDSDIPSNVPTTTSATVLNTTKAVTTKLLGTFGDFACASLYANKIVHGGDAGFVLAKDIKLEYYFKSIVNHGFTGSFHFLHFVSAMNAKINGLGAALACAGISAIEIVLNNRSYIANYYRSKLKHLVDAKFITLMPICGVNDTPWVFGLHTYDKHTRDSIREYLASFGVETRNYFFPNNLQPCFLSHYQANIQLINAESISKTGFYIPTYYDLTEKDLNYICARISSYFIPSNNSY